MPLLENLAIAALLVLLQAWCAGWAFALLRAVQASKVEAIPILGAWLMVAAALLGVAFGLWSSWRIARWWRIKA